MYDVAVRQALIKDGWIITHDPLTLSFGVHNLYVDLGAERVLAARRLVLAVPLDAFDTILSTELGRAIREDYALSILVFDATQEIIRQWLP
jgi:hypothetical protein